jgi:hypothetical protein
MVHEGKPTLSAHGTFALTSIRRDPVTDAVLWESQFQASTIITEPGQDIPCGSNACTRPL